MDVFLNVLLPMTLFVIMFLLGLSLVIGDFKRIAQAPKAFAVGIFCRMVAMPLAGFALAILFRLPPELGLGLVILALCPGGASSVIMTRVARGDVALSLSLTAVSTLLAVVTMPLLTELAADYFIGLEAGDLDVSRLGLSMFALTTLPVIAGMTVRRLAPAFAQLAERLISPLAMVLMIVVVGGILMINWTLFIENLPLLGPSAIALNLVTLIVALGLARLMSLTEGQATALALEVGIQNAALGVAVGTLVAHSAGDVAPASVPAGVYGITMYAVCLTFTFWQRNRAVRSDDSAGSSVQPDPELSSR
ncbi:bile acid:sodium symporter family protein [Arvimicrobium flavum]|uniref:bile acid:sodium symporter family protein n=1 Tax=Arvimicrobium flavum TaxID=3393320 RepID=UPI00237C0C41|nr:bile acid:sodium symporter family protein [Mesorhizobium shangrilense]